MLEGLVSVGIVRECVYVFVSKSENATFTYQTVT